MKDLYVGQGFGVVQAANRMTLGVIAGIALAGHHHADGRTRIPLQRRKLVEPSVDRRFEHVEQIGFQPHQQRLALGIAEADVVFQHLRALLGDHQAGVENAAKRPPGTLHRVDRGHQDVLLDPVQHIVGDQRGRAVGAHAAGVRAGVAVVGRFVILGRRERDDRPAVGDGQHAGLLAVEPLLDHQPVAGGAEDFLPGDFIDGIQGLVAIRQTNTPLPAARPSALTTTGTSSRSWRNLTASSALVKV